MGAGRQAQVAAVDRDAAIAQAVESESYQQFQDNSGNLVVYRDSAEFTSFVEDQFGIFQDLLG